MSSDPTSDRITLSKLTSETVRLFGSAQFKVGAQPITSFIPTLGTREEVCLGRAGVKRRREFATARSLARRLLHDIGYSCTDIPRHHDGYPDWPQGTWGSISHTQNIALVAVRTGPRGFGLDIEGSAPLREELHPHILRPRELHSYDKSRREKLAKIVFSAKEAFYKAQYPLTHAFLNFHDVEIRLDEYRQQYSVTVYHPVSKQLPLENFHGAWTIVPPYVVTTAYFPIQQAAVALIR